MIYKEKKHQIGFGIWKFPYFTYIIEILFVLMGWLLIKQRNAFSYVFLFLMIASFSEMVFGDEPEIMKHNDFLRTSVVLISNGLFIFHAYLSDRKQNIE